MHDLGVHLTIAERFSIDAVCERFGTAWFHPFVDALFERIEILRGDGVDDDLDPGIAARHVPRPQA